MKQFNLDEYLKNPSRKVVTRNGLNARIICVDREHSYYPIVALVKIKYGEVPICYTKNGETKLNNLYVMDLFFATEKHDGWVNLYKDVDNSTYPGDIYDSKAEAKKEIDKNDDYVTTVKIEWEE